MKAEAQEMEEHTSPTFFLFPSLTVAWALWVLEGLHLSALKGFSREQLHVSTIFLVLMFLPLKVTWSLCVPSEVGNRLAASGFGET